jgi:hypothetical protein
MVSRNQNVTDYAWHDCYGDSAPPQSVTEDIWTVSAGDLRKLTLLHCSQFRIGVI